MPTIGQPAPTFILASSEDRDIDLETFHGKKRVVLVFYPLDFSSVCSIQLPEYSGRQRAFEARDTVVLAVNRDSIYTHKAWAKEFDITIPLLADMTGTAARAYGVHREEVGFSKRAVFIIDKGGILRFAHIEKAGEFILHADDILRELDRLQG